MDKGIIFSAPMVRALLDGRKGQTRRLLKVRKGLTLGEVIERGERAADGYRVTRGMLAPPQYAPGDRLYVREACRAEELSRPQSIRPAARRERARFKRTEVVVMDELDGADGVRFLADDAWLKIENTRDAADRWLDLFSYGGERPSGRIGRSVPSIHMPRWASRLWLLVTDVRVQRVAEIGSADAEAEGVERHPIARGWKNYRDERLWCAAPETSFESLWNSLHTKPGETWEANPWIVAISFTVHHGNIDNSNEGAGRT